MKTILQSLLAIAWTGAGIVAAYAVGCGYSQQSKDHDSLVSCYSVCTNCCAYTAYTPVCTFCGPSLPEISCYSDESYESVTQGYTNGNCDGQGYCSGGIPSGNPGTETCYYCSEGTCGG